MDIITIVSNLLSHDSKTRTEAQELMSKLATENFESYLVKLGNLLVDEKQAVNVRVAATTMIKNPIAYVKEYTEKWLSFSNDSKSKIRNFILSALGSKAPEIRRASASVIATIAKIDCPLSTNWPDLLPILCNEKFENKDFHMIAIETLGYICEELTNKQILSDEIDQILSAIVLCMQGAINKLKEEPNNTVYYNLCVISMKALIRAIPLISNKKMNNKSYSDILMNEIFRLGDAFQSNEQILELICRSFIEISENYYDCVEYYLDKISVFTLFMISTKNERLKLLGFEFWYRLGIEELERSKMIINKRVCKLYFQSYYYKLKEVIDNNILSSNIDSDNEDEWNSSKASCSLLVILVQVIKEDLFNDLISGIKGKFIIITLN